MTDEATRKALTHNYTWGIHERTGTRHIIKSSTDAIVFQTYCGRMIRLEGGRFTGPLGQPFQCLACSDRAIPAMQRRFEMENAK